MSKNFHIIGPNLASALSQIAQNWLTHLAKWFKKEPNYIEIV